MKLFRTLSVVFNIVTALLTLLLLNYAAYYRDLNYIANDFIGANSTRIVTPLLSNYIYMKGFYNANANREFGIIQADGDESVLGVLIKNYKQRFSLSDGRYFRNSDFFANVRVAIVGTNISVDVGDTIGLRGKNYVVIGKINFYPSGSINNIIFYNLDSNPYSNTSVYDIDCNSDRQLSNTVNLLIDSANAKRVLVNRVKIGKLIGTEIGDKPIPSLLILMSLLLQVLKIIILSIENNKRLRILFFMGFPRINVTLTTVVSGFFEYALIMIVLLVLLLTRKNVVGFDALQFVSVSVLSGVALEGLVNNFRYSFFRVKSGTKIYKGEKDR